MTKKVLSLALALAMCLGLSVPAFAEELNYTTEELDKMAAFYSSYSSTIAGLQYYVGETIPIRVEGKDRTLDSYRVFGKDDKFYYKNTGEEGCTLSIDLYVYEKNSDGVYVWDEKYYELRTNGKFVDDEIEANDKNGYRQLLKPGEESHHFSFFDFAAETLGGDKGDHTYMYEIAPYFQFDNDSSGEYWIAPHRIHMYDPAAVERINAADPLKSFTDVKADSPYAWGIRWAVSNNVTNGKTATTFAPGDVCTVSHILTFLWRANGRPGAGSNERDSVVAWAKELGIDTSDLSAPCTRAMAVEFMWKAAGSPKPAKSASFTDVAPEAGYAQAVAWAVARGITSGTSATTFAPANTCTRGQIVTFLYRSKLSV